MEEFINSDIFKWVIFPLVIFISRIIDVSLGTTRIIMISKGRKELAMLIGFFEITIWVLVSAQVIRSLDNFVFIIAYAGGFAAGNYIGMVIDEKIAMGKVSVRLILNKDPSEVIEKLKENGYGVTHFEATGSRGKAYVIYSIMHRKKLEEFSTIVTQRHPKAFISVEDTRLVREGVFQEKKKKTHFRKMLSSRKIK
ncbi:MAG: DUF2179 domain-containing protein [Spirochaetales bacterium]|nr:DUF2179 domain-containing protein [Spirochaetales bacterium]